MEEKEVEEKKEQNDFIRTGQVFDYFCEFCKEEDLDIKAEGYCVDCTEYLCHACYNAHRRSRSTRHHELLDQDHMPKISQLSHERKNKYISTRCSEQCSHAVEYYCVSHNCFVCTDCFLKEHRRCDKIEVVLDESENIINSQEHLDFLRNLQEMEKRSSFMAKGIHDRKETSMQNSENAKKQIRDATKEFHIIIDEAEQSLVKQMEVILSEDYGVNDEVEEICQAIRVLIEETETIAASRRVCQLYIQMKEKQNEIMFLEDRLRKVEGRKYVTNITFEPNCEIRNAFHAACLGQLTVKKGRGKSESKKETTSISTTFDCHENDATNLDQVSLQVDQQDVLAVTSPSLSVEESPVTELLPPNQTVDEVPATIEKHITAIPFLKPNTEQEQVRILREITDRAKAPYVLGTITTQHKDRVLSRDISLEQRLIHFLTAISAPNKRGFQYTLEDAASNAALTIIIVYNSDNQNRTIPAIECDLFLEDIWITKHVGTEGTKQDWVKDLCCNAWTILTQKQASDVLTETRRLTYQDLFGPFMHSVYIMGVGNTVHSNSKTLAFYGHDLGKVNSKRFEDIIVFELNDWSSDRQTHAISIINLTCKRIGLLLQWEIMSVPDTNTTENVRCKVYIQQQMLGDSYGTSKTRAMHLAFEKALYTLYKQQRVIRMNMQGDQKEWILYDDLEEEADQTKALGLKPEIPVCDETGKAISSFVVKAAYKRVQSFVVEKSDELVFAPGMFTDERNAICYIGRKLNLKCDLRSQDGQAYFALLKHIEWTELFERLCSTTSPHDKFSRYCRVDMKDIPKSAKMSNQTLMQSHMNTDPCEVTERGNDIIKNDANLQPQLSKLSPKGLKAKPLTLAKKLDVLRNFLRNTEIDSTLPVAMLSKAALSVKLDLKLEYIEEEVGQVANRKIFTGYLKINKQFIVRDIGTKKKKIKTGVYKKSIALLKDKPGTEIVRLRDPGPGQMQKDLGKQIQRDVKRKTGALDVKKTSSVPVTDSQVLTASSLEELKTKVKAMKVSSDTDYISNIENVITKTKPSPGHEYLVQDLRPAKGQLHFVGQLSFGPLVIGRGNGLSKKTCKLDTYKKAWYHLTNNPLSKLTVSTPEEETLAIEEQLHSNKQQQLSRNETNQPNLQQPVHTQIHLNHKENLQHLVDPNMQRNKQLQHKEQSQQSNYGHVYPFSNTQSLANSCILDAQLIASDSTVTTATSMAKVDASSATSLAIDDIGTDIIEHGALLPTDTTIIAATNTRGDAVIYGNQPPLSETSSCIAKVSSIDVNSQTHEQVSSNLCQTVYTPAVATEVMAIASISTAESTGIKAKTVASEILTSTKARHLTSEFGTTEMASTTDRKAIILNTLATLDSPTFPDIVDVSEKETKDKTTISISTEEKDNVPSEEESTSLLFTDTTTSQTSAITNKCTTVAQNIDASVVQIVQTTRLTNPGTSAIETSLAQITDLSKATTLVHSTTNTSLEAETTKLQTSSSTKTTLQPNAITVTSPTTSPSLENTVRSNSIVTSTSMTETPLQLGHPQNNNCLTQ